MKLLSVNISAPKPAEWDARTVITGIFKEPVNGRVRVTPLTLEGDAQVDRRYHGGPNKAVYAYPFEHYAKWQEFLNTELSPGQFGENLTVTGMLEENVCLGDVYQVGSAVLEVTQPRVPCFKLAMKMRMPSFPKWFLKSGRLGFYLRVLQEGEIGADDTIEKLREDGRHHTIHDVWQYSYGDAFDAERIREILERDTLGGEWTKPLREKLMEGV
ncbi:MAG: MOSC domain-containing protein [Planctomycetes bacterium]|nr:MOSC domain-containing protein [Planctomycetota bacterium]